MVSEKTTRIFISNGHRQRGLQNFFSRCRLHTTELRIKMSIDDHALGSLATRLTTQRHAIWLGAGISLASGIPTVGPFRSLILRGLGLNGSEISQYVQAMVPFESLFEVLMSVVDCDHIFRVFQGQNPTLGHYVIAQLVKHKMVQTIVTTNFDSLLESALDKEGVKFDLYASDKVFPSIDWSADRVRLIKLHGTIDNTGELALTIRRVAARQHTDVRSKVVHELFENEDSGGVVILGYSCSDHFDVSPAARAASRPDRKVVYVSHEERDIAEVSNLKELQPNNPFVGFENIAVTCNTDAFLQSVLEQISGTIPKKPPSKNINPEWRLLIKFWLKELERTGTAGTRSHIAGLVLKSANLWAKSNEYLKAAIKTGLSADALPRVMLAMGNNHRDLGQYQQAELTLQDALSKARQESQVQSEARILNSLGIVAADKNEQDSAIGRYMLALELARTTEDRELEGKCHGNLGIAYKNRNAAGDLYLSLGHHTIARDVAVEIGDKRSEGRALGNIGLVYRALNEVPIACKYYDAARMIAESLGDLLHVGIWLHNAGEDLADIEPEAAIPLLSKSKEIFLRLEQIDYAEQSNSILEELT